MASNFYQQTGIILLDNVTPVIKTIFSAFTIGEVRNGSASFISDDDNNLHWESLREDLVRLAEEMQIELPVTADRDSTDDWIAALLGHFAPADEDLRSLVLGSDEQPTMGELFRLARNLDDGHGLIALKLEGAWTCTKPIPFAFGGNGEYYGQHVMVQTSSQSAVSIGDQLENKLAADLPKAAADVLLNEVLQLLNGIHNPDARSAVQRALGEKLLTGEGDRQWYAVNGRIPGDDDDTLQVFRVASVAEAHAAFEASMYEDETDPEAAREANRRACGVSVFINATATSKTPIDFV